MRNQFLKRRIGPRHLTGRCSPPTGLIQGGYHMATAASPGLAGSKEPLSSQELRKMHAYWRAANYLSVGQIYLCANPLLREARNLQHIKSRLLRDLGTTTRLKFI